MSYKETVFLPKSSLPVKNKAESDQAVVKQWETNGLYEERRKAREGSNKFVLTDGPPYANGDIHIGHAMNKVLKDIIVRGRSMLGQDTVFVPGWDCHGLPIEWKVEEQWRKAKKDKNEDPVGFRNDCFAYAKQWVETQQAQFQKLGVVADWANRYETHDPAHESTILAIFHKMVEKGLVYSALKPTLWSPAEKTALAEAEVVEREHTAPQLWVKFPIVAGDCAGASILVWTTTPWSLPANAAIAFNPANNYSLYLDHDEMFVIADDCAEKVLSPDAVLVKEILLEDFDEMLVEHPFDDAGYPLTGDEMCHLLPASYVRNDTGTGFVHVGPSHSYDDWSLWRDNFPGRDFPQTILPTGVYGDIPLFAGVAVTKGKKLGPANDAVIAALEERDCLHMKKDAPLTLQHSWRSDAVLLTLATKQWFIALDGAREEALMRLGPVYMEPYTAKARMFNMIRDRPDWLISRQRLWGTPMAIIVHKATGAPCRDPVVLGAIHQTLADRGPQCWSELSLEELFASIGRDDVDEWEKVTDVLDVWFDSGCVQWFHSYPEADLIIEGTDQARGWFQSSLMVGALLSDTLKQPYKNVLTHGFVLAENGLKMSKSIGNVVNPLSIVDKYGVDALRVWVANINWRNDVRISDQSIENAAEVARKIRGTLRYIVGALDGFDKPVAPVEYTGLEAYILHELRSLDSGTESLTGLMANNQLTTYMTRVFGFCDLVSSLLFDVRKDLLYCGSSSDPARKMYLNALSEVFDYVTKWIAPIMPVAAEEVWAARYPDAASVHLETWDRPMFDMTSDERGKWSNLLQMREKVMVLLEQARKDGLLKTPAEAKVVITANKETALYADLMSVDFAELAIVAEAEIVEGQVDDPIIDVFKTEYGKCERCWRHVVFEHALCGRCQSVVLEVSDNFMSKSGL